MLSDLVLDLNLITIFLHNNLIILKKVKRLSFSRCLGYITGITRITRSFELYCYAFMISDKNTNFDSLCVFRTFRDHTWRFEDATSLINHLLSGDLVLNPLKNR